MPANELDSLLEAQSSVSVGSMSVKLMETLVEEAKQKFEQVFGCQPTLGAWSAGRVNLIGEHVDYNDGFVMPMAIPLYTIIVGKLTFDNDKCKIYSTNVDENERLVEFELTFESGKTTSQWSKYFLGVVALYKAKSVNFNALIHSSLPLGGGLSSSASLEMATLKFLEIASVDGPNLELTEKALLCQKAEHEYAQVPCGIMDQFSCALSRKNHAMLLDCRSLSYEYLPINDPNLVILVINSNVKHELSKSEYPVRRRMCHEAAAKLNKKSLRDVTFQELSDNSALLDQVALKRAKHVVTEIERTIMAAKALKGNDYVTFGRLMKESHASLRDDFEVSCKELDELVELASNFKGVYGSRMTGGGFGGCTVTLVEREHVDALCEHIKKNYHHLKEPVFYICTAVEGSNILNL